MGARPWPAGANVRHVHSLGLVASYSRGRRRDVAVAACRGVGRWLQQLAGGRGFVVPSGGCARPQRFSSAPRPRAEKRVPCVCCTGGWWCSPHR